jgi:hypothetical protein
MLGWVGLSADIHLVRRASLIKKERKREGEEGKSKKERKEKGRNGIIYIASLFSFCPSCLWGNYNNTADSYQWIGIENCR